MNVNRAVVWDLDGVIVDSAEAHNLSWQGMAADFGVPYDPDKDFKGIFGRRNTDIISSLWGVTDPQQIERMAERKEEIFRQLARELRPLPGVVELVLALDAAGWRQGIGSSAPLANIELLLAVTDLQEYIQAIASGEDVSRGKPDPQVFLLAFERLGVAPSNGLVIEDAPAGVRGGIAVGAACVVGVATTQSMDTLREAGADMVVPTLEGLTVNKLEQLVAHK